MGRQTTIMAYPTVKFEISPEQDCRNYRMFVKYSEPRFLPMFLPSDLAERLASAKGGRSENSVARDFVEGAFESQAGKISRNVAAVEKKWRMNEPRYFELMSKVFKNHPWPKGKYVGYASVFRMYPRDVSDKTFYFPALDSSHAQATIAHEMTHFMFFDYIRKAYGLAEDSDVTGRGKAYVWNVSEVFNLTLEGWSPYQRIFRTSARPYDAAHARMQPRMARLWRERQDIGWLLDRYFGSVSRRSI